jgi:hypothetical protein
MVKISLPLPQTFSPSPSLPYARKLTVSELNAIAISCKRFFPGSFLTSSWEDNLVQ